MSNTEREHESLIFRVKQLEQLQHLLAKLIEAMESRLDDLSERFNNRPELQQLTSLQNVLTQPGQQIDERSTLPVVPVEVVNEPTKESSCTEESHQQSTQVQSYENQLVFDRSGSRAVLMEALEQAQERLIIICPWLNRNSIDAGLIQKFRECLNRNCRIEIGWGHLSDRSRLGKGWRYDALKDLRQLERDYPNLFRLKLLGTHEKFLVCDSIFAMLGSHNLLTSSTQSAEREVGIRTTDPHIIQGLINRFDGAEVQDSQAIDESLVENSVSLDDTKALDAQNTGEESDAILVHPDNGETDQDIDDLDEDSQELLVNTEEFLRRYNNKERDFAGINLSGANLSEVNLAYRGVNLSKAILSKTNLNRADLNQAELNGVNLKGADISQANLTNAKLEEANLDNANINHSKLYQANLRKAKLKKANLSKANLHATNLSGANLSEANLSGASLSSETNLSGANLSGTNLSGAYLRAAKLMKVDLRNANLSNANLLEANLEGAAFQEVKLTGALYSTGTVFPKGFDPVKAGAFLIAHNVSLQHKNLAGANLSLAELSGASLNGTNLVGANLNSTSLIQANLNRVDLSQASLLSANLTAASLLSANLMNASLEGTNLAAADLSGSNLRWARFNNKTKLSGANLSGANLAGQDLQKINMSGVNMSNANLCGAWLCFSNFSGANFTSADLRGADLGGANLEKANLTGANLTGADLDGAKLSGAIMPDGTVHD